MNYLGIVEEPLPISAPAERAEEIAEEAGTFAITTALAVGLGAFAVYYFFLRDR